MINKLSAKQLKGLTSIRFFLAIWVVLYHNCEEFADTGYYFDIIKNGHVAVSGFFLLSGLVLAYNYNREYNIKNYLQNRFARIYPLYLFSLLLAFPLFSYFQYKTNTNYINEIIQIGLASVLMIQSWNYSWLLQLNPPTWSLSVEAFLYLLFPVLMVLFRTKRNTFIILTQLLIYGIFLITFSTLLGESDYQYASKPFMYIPTFTIGLLTGIFISNNKTSFFKISNKISLYLIFGAVVLLLLLFLQSKLYSEHILELGVLAPFYVCVFLILAYNPNLLSSKILIRLGEISYAIYLLHQPLRSYLFFLFKNIGMINYYIQFGIYLALLILLSNYVYLYLELPLHKKLKYNPVQK